MIQLDYADRSCKSCQIGEPKTGEPKTWLDLGLIDLDVIDLGVIDLGLSVGSVGQDS